MRSDTQSEDRGRPCRVEASVERGCRVLRGDELVEERADPRPQVRPELVLAFMRALIRNTMNGDVIALCLMSARRQTGASDEEIQLLTEAIRNERPLCNGSDFFPGF